MTTPTLSPLYLLKPILRGVMLTSFYLFLVAPSSRAESKAVNVAPGSVVFVGFQTTTAGEDHALTINNANPNCDIESSGILAQDEADTIQWKKISATADTHVYKIAGVRTDEPLWVHIRGTFKCGGGGAGTGAGTVASQKPDFDVIVPFVELSVDGDNETSDMLAGNVPDGVGNYLPGEEGTTKKLTETGFRPQKMRLIASPVDGQIVDRVTFTIESVTSLSGYCSDASDPQVQGANKDDDFSFKADIDDTTENHTAIVNRHAVVDFFCKDYGGKCVVRADFMKGNQVKASAKIQIPLDADGDGIADKWEKEQVEAWNTQYGVNEVVDTGFFSANDDKEIRDPDGSGALAQHKDGGDGLTALQEYRGFDFKSATSWGGDSGHKRLSPARKELLVEVDRSVDGTAVAATRPEVMDAMSKAKTAFMNSAGVRLCYVVDNVRSEKASFTAHDEQVAYVNANYNTTPDVDRSEYVYLLFAFKVFTGADIRGGVASKDYHGGLIGCGTIRQESTRRFFTLYDIPFKDALGYVVTHELGHAVGCDDHQSYDLVPGLNIRKLPGYAPAQPTTWMVVDEGINLNAKLLTGSNPVLEDFKLDLYATDSVTMNDVMQAINGLTNKYETIGATVHRNKHAWLLRRVAFIQNIPDGADPRTWSPVQIFKEISTVMTYNPSVQKYKNIQFNNNPDQTFEYGREIGSMDVKKNYSAANN